MLRRLAGDQATSADVQALRTLVDIVEPVKGYRRGELQPGVVQSTPLTSLADCARPDSAAGAGLRRIGEPVSLSARPA